MKLFKIFNKNKKRIVTQELISLNALAKVPDIDYFKDNNQFLLLINLRKKEYLETLIKEKVLTSSELKSGKLQNKLNMLHNLIEQNTLGNDLFEKVVFDEEDKVKALIILRKFTIYNEKIIELEEEVVSRIIALKEILKRTFLNKQKRMSIINEVNRLTNVFIVLMNQKETLRVCLSSYSKKCFDITKERDLEKEEDLIRKRKKELNGYQEQAFGKINIEINDLNDMAQVEVALENYVYNYKEKALSLKDEIIYLYNHIEKDIDNQSKDVDQLLTEILALENKCKIFYEFGKNIIDNEDLKRIYRLKFDFFTTWRYVNGVPKLIEVFVDYTTPEDEINTFKEIIYEIIKNLNSLDNLGNLARKFNIDSIIAINLLRLIKKELQTNGKYDPKEILMDKYKLNILLAFTDSINTRVLREIYRNIYVLKNSYPEVNFYEPIFNWNDYLPLETINELKLIQNQKKDLGLYLFLKKYINDYLSEAVRYTLPEGLKIINTIFIHDISDDVRYFINVLQKNMEGKDVIMPSTLKILEGNIFESTPIKTLILNDELEYCDFDILASSAIQGITIPTVGDLLMFYYNYFSLCNCKRLRTVEFKNFDQSKFYNNFDRFYSLLYPFIDATYLYPFVVASAKTRLYELNLDAILFTFSTGETIIIKRKDWQVKYTSVAIDKSVLVKKINKKLTYGVNLNNKQKRELTKH